MQLFFVILIFFRFPFSDGLRSLHQHNPYSAAYRRGLKTGAAATAPEAIAAPPPAAPSTAPAIAAAAAAAGPLPAAFKHFDTTCARMANLQHYSLKWNNHPAHIVNHFDQLLGSESLVDCTLVTEDTHVKAHKVILSACR